MRVDSYHDSEPNLTRLSLKNESLVWYFVLVVAIAGVFAYGRLGRMEDPDFTVKSMVVTAAWPGATAAQMEEQVTDKLERKFQDLPGIDKIRSCTRPGSTIIYIDLRDEVKTADIRPTWRDLRNFGEDIRRDLPSGVVGPFYNDRFDDVFGSIYAITGEGYSLEEKRAAAERIRRMILTLPAVQKVQLLGVQTEKVYIEAEMSKLAALGISPSAIGTAIQNQNEIAPAAMVETESDNIYLRVTGTFDDVEAIRQTPIVANGRVFRLGDVATVERRYAEPPDTQMFFNGQPAVGIAVAMEPGHNVITLGEDLTALMAHVREQEPLGLDIARVSDQPQVVRDSISEFVGSLRDAVVIVLVCSFLSLGFRTGMVVACCIPLVLLGTFAFMYGNAIDLHKVSLGTLIMSLGLLVDDAIIAVEMMSVKLEEGMERVAAACHAYKVTAKSMLTGTLVTCAGFIPVAFNPGVASEYCKALFPVMVTALLLSWVISVTVAPLFGCYLIKSGVRSEESGVVDRAIARVKGFLHLKPSAESLHTPNSTLQTGQDPRQGKFYTTFRKILVWFLTHKLIVLLATLAIFASSLRVMRYVKQEFFPPSLRPEVIISMYLPEGASKAAIADAAATVSDILLKEPDHIDNFSYYVGEGAPRFVLPFEPKPPAANYAQFVVVATDWHSREALVAKLKPRLADELPAVRFIVQPLQMGPPASFPLMLRVSGLERDKVRELAEGAVDILKADDNLVELHMDWHEKAKALRLTLDQDKLRQLGISGKELAQTLYTEITGASVAQYYRGDRTISIEFKLNADNRDDPSALGDLPVYLAGSKRYVPLSQLARLSFDAEDSLIWRHNLRPTVTIQAEVREGTANDVTVKALARLKDWQKALPYGYALDPGGAYENSIKSMHFLMQPVPVMVLIILTLLMCQLRSLPHAVLCLLTAPMGIIGVAYGMWLFDVALGFVANIGILALTGMIIRNSIILIDQIDQHIAEGESVWEAIIDSAVLRFRPIMLTAVTDILGMVPLLASTFWAPMAVAIGCGLVVATALTLLVLPTMYAAVYRVKP